MKERFLEQEKLFKKQLDECNGSYAQYFINKYSETDELPLNTNLFAKQELPETPLENVDYTRKKLWSKFKSRMSFIPAYLFYRKAKKKFKFEIKNREVFNQLKTGAVITSNHISIYDSLPIIDCQLHMKKRKRIYKVIQEANYYMKGVFGVFMRNNYTLPLTRSMSGMRRFLTACDTILKKGELILIYPEQELWPDYDKPRATRPGAFQIACRSNAPVIPCFTQIRNYTDKKGRAKQQYITHVLDPIYPNPELKNREKILDVQIRHFNALKELYEKIYNKPLTFGE